MGVVPFPPSAAAMESVWRLGRHTCASVPRATEVLCVTSRMTLPTPARPSSVTMGSATSLTEESPTARASPASAGSTVNKVGCTQREGLIGSRTLGCPLPSLSSLVLKSGGCSPPCSVPHLLLHNKYSSSKPPQASLRTRAVPWECRRSSASGVAVYLDVAINTARAAIPAAGSPPVWCTAFGFPLCENREAGFP